MLSIMAPRIELARSDVALETVICSSIFTALATSSICLHTYVKIKLMRHYVLRDELPILLTFLLVLALVAQTIWAVVHDGQGQHMSSVTQEDIDHMAKVFELIYTSDITMNMAC